MGPTILSSSGITDTTSGTDMAGKVLGSAVDQLFKNWTGIEMPSVTTSYTEQMDAIASGPNGTGIDIKGTNSIFNPFYSFRYSKFSDAEGKQYNVDLHRDSSGPRTPGNINILQGQMSVFDKEKQVIENPGAQQIIEWATRTSQSDLGVASLSTMPYQWSDFLWCKLYGKIPNNRMITLRRFPIPVEDNLQIAESKGTLVPTAQAVTWWGGESDNKLSSIIGMEYGFKWKSIDSKVQDVTGNEVTASSVLDTLGLTQGDNGLVRKALLAALADDPNNAFDSAGTYGAKIQEWVKNSYGSEGQYWNRILGPVNVINSTLIRDRGYTFKNDIRIKFSYKLRSINGINPKVAMLDLISNFLSLTYNRASFWGGSARYFKQPGLLAGLPTEKFNQGDFEGGAKDLLSAMLAKVQGKSEELGKLLSDMALGLGSGDMSGALTELGQSNIAQSLAASWVSNILQVPLTMRSFLDGRAVGEWHITVGNPMNPIAAIGNLCVQSTKIEFSEDLGSDDFPNEVSFIVTLSHGRPRAKQDIESMFNLGAGDMYFSYLPPPSSAFNSHGERNSINLNNATPSTKAEERTSSQQVVNAAQGAASGVNMIESSDGNAAFIPDGVAEFYKTKVRTAYGERYSNSPILMDYFRDLKTKD